MECGCIPRGICMQHLTRQTRDCSGQHELCCIPQHKHNDVVVNVFSNQEKVKKNINLNCTSEIPPKRGNATFVLPMTSKFYKFLDKISLKLFLLVPTNFLFGSP